MIVTLIIVGLIGILVGGVLNVLADDLPHKRPIRLPPRYPDGTPRPLIAWLGLTAYLFHRRAGADGKKLRWRYPATELLTAFLMIITILATSDDHAMTLGQIASHDRSLGKRGRAIVHRGVCDIHPRQATDQRLELIDTLQHPLADLRLIGRIGSIELGPAGNMADDRGDVVVVDPGAEKTGKAVHIGAFGREGDQMLFERNVIQSRRDVRKIRLPDDLFRNRREQLADTPDTDRFQHTCAVGIRIRDVGHEGEPFSKCVALADPGKGDHYYSYYSPISVR